MQQLHDEYAAALWGFCLHLTSDPVRAEDVAQETLLRAWRHSQSSTVAPAVRAWLFTVARNIVIDEWRSTGRRTRHRSAEVPEQGDAVDQSDSAAAVLGGRRGAHPALPRAPRRPPRVLLPRPVGGRGLPPARGPEGTVKSRTHYALRALRLALEEMGVGA